MKKRLGIYLRILVISLIVSGVSGMAQGYSLEGDEIREDISDPNRITKTIGVVKNGGERYRPFSFRINNVTVGGVEVANGYQALNVNMAEHSLVTADGDVIETSFQAIRDSSLVVAVADGYQLNIDVISTGVDANGNTVATGVSAVEAQNVQTIQEVDKKGSVVRVYNTASYGDFSGPLAGQQMETGSTPMKDLSSGDLVRLAITGGNIKGEAVLAENLTGFDKELTYSGGTTQALPSEYDGNPVNGIFDVNDGWYVRSLANALRESNGEKSRYSDLVYVKGGKIVAIVEARPASSSGAPLPGVWATLALCGAVGGYLKRRKVS